MKNALTLRSYLLFALIPLADNMQFAVTPPLKNSATAHEAKKETDIPPAEDLMREHGVLNRLLLIYEKIIEQMNDQNNFQKTALLKAIDLVKTFIEDYHEKLEEEYIFPLFEKHHQELRFIKTLRLQHIKGREITARLQSMLKTHTTLNATLTSEIKTLLQKFITMYRPHQAQEDTVLFPQLRTLLSDKELKELSAAFEKREHALFGDQGFQTIVKKVTLIEKTVGIYKLEQFTPKSTGR